MPGWTVGDKKSHLSERQRSAIRCRSTMRWDKLRLLSCSLIASPAWPPPMMSVSTFSTDMRGTFLRCLGNFSRCAWKRPGKKTQLLAVKSILKREILLSAGIRVTLEQLSRAIHLLQSRHDRTRPLTQQANDLLEPKVIRPRIIISMGVQPRGRKQLDQVLTSHPSWRSKLALRPRRQLLL